MGGHRRSDQPSTAMPKRTLEEAEGDLEGVSAKRRDTEVSGEDAKLIVSSQEVNCALHEATLSQKAEISPDCEISESNGHHKGEESEADTPPESLDLNESVAEESRECEAYQTSREVPNGVIAHSVEAPEKSETLPNGSVVGDCEASESLESTASQESTELTDASGAGPIDSEVIETVTDGASVSSMTLGPEVSVELDLPAKIEPKELEVKEPSESCVEPEKSVPSEEGGFENGVDGEDTVKDGCAPDLSEQTDQEDFLEDEEDLRLVIAESEEEPDSREVELEVGGAKLEAKEAGPECVLTADVAQVVEVTDKLSSQVHEDEQDEPASEISKAYPESKSHESKREKVDPEKALDDLQGSSKVSGSEDSNHSNQSELEPMRNDETTSEPDNVEEVPEPGRTEETRSEPMSETTSEEEAVVSEDSNSSVHTNSSCDVPSSSCLVKGWFL